MSTAEVGHDIEPLTVREVFRSGRYVVPVYQRAYAWGETQILTLLQDVADYRRRGAASYYIGSLVTHRGHDITGDDLQFEVVDGQQRLTTLFIILSTLSHLHDVQPERGVLSYEGRKSSTRDLAIVARDGDKTVVGDLAVAGIRVAVETVRAAVETGHFTPDDLSYLIDHVKVARTALPVRTDLNHYFEVMNSRGEQLEKHEIAKAHLMSLIAGDDDADARSHAFAVVWDACSDLSRHVQGRFPPTIRDELFGRDTWDEFRSTSFDDIVGAIKATPGGELKPTALSAILAGTVETEPAAGEKEDDAIERFGAIIDFPNFLLHVLAIADPYRADFSWTETSVSGWVSLDDKKLVEQFERVITERAQAEAFAFTLLRVRYLFDKYVIKTDLTRASEDDSNWVLNRARLARTGNKRKLTPVATFARGVLDDDAVMSGDQRHIVILQSMFQVTDSRRAYKNFLYAILDYLHRQDAVAPADFISFLRGLAAQRYATTIDRASLDSGTSVPHFALNYLDYLLWSDPHGYAAAHGADVAGYKFRYRTSIEHFHPQHPDPDSQIPMWPKSDVDRFGNLCIMTRSENSQRSNLAPVAKVGQYRWERQTLKFQIMAGVTRHTSTWTLDHVHAHGQAMRAILDAAAGSGGIE
ncbi:DUF262 domain-containing HNH endonuclease family protein [Demequina sp. SYSU T00039]|uniref:DUF262 domain-containing HNH endonuclease family protein n=1 Tax=Demequina lignilytica TaxID=3051663 RepID=A0AAW7M628_9MICO|nr:MULTISPECIES: DUF262 domain-containing HNH endonuclease family protein [unclassified Demequina]MDN4478655.1 DUF262 domain-containing HNH endonuclease family protein [Demequina sp. SYSU T00039-1]MDN4488633.1 DUF262 domain-containing HNH endonuclease family protein [Demequina sp. SYSU T00039]